MLTLAKIAKWVAPHYRKIESGLIQCRNCDKTFRSGHNNYDKVRHLRDCGIINTAFDEKWKSDTSHFIWKYFTKENTFGAKCKKCPTLITRGHHKTELYSHIYSYHGEIITALQKEITSSWMSEYFTFSEYNAICKRCPNIKPKNRISLLKKKINILAERQAFVDHLHIKHKINKPNIRDNNVEILQQSVDEGNIAGPSSHHDNTRSDDSSLVLPNTSTLKNFIQKDQLRETRDNNVEMLQQSVENVAGPSSHHDDIRFDDDLLTFINSFQGELRCEKEDNKLEMLQQSVDKENVAGPSSHDNDIRFDVDLLTFLNSFQEQLRETSIEDLEKDYESDDLFGDISMIE